MEIIRKTFSLFFLFVVLITFFIVLNNASGFLLPSYIILANVYLGSLVLLKDFRSPINQLFGVMVFSVSAWTFSLSMLHEAGVEQVLFWGKAIFLGPIILPAAFLCFCRLFPVAGRKARVLILFSPAAVMICLLAFGLIIKDVLVVGGKLTPVRGVGYPIFGVYFITYILLGVGELFNKQKTATGIQKIQIRYVLAGAFLSLLFGSLTNLVMPMLGSIKFTLLGPYATLIFIVFISYAILKHRLMSIEIVIQKGVIYSIASLAIIGSYSIIVVISEQYLRGMIGYSSTIITAIAVFIIAAAFQPLIRFLQNWTDRRFFRQRYDYQTALRNLSRDILTKIKLEDLVSLIVSSFIEIIKISKISFLMLDKKTGKYNIIFGTDKTIESALNDDLINRLKETRRVLNVDDLPPGASRFKLLIPVVLRDELTAVIALGEKLSGDVYNDEDLHLLNTIANQTALALDNVYLYNEIRQVDKLASLGIIAAGVAHEIKNPLASIKGMSEMVNYAFEDKDKEFIADFRKVVPKEIDRINELVQNLLTYSKPSKPQRTAVNINDILTYVLKLFEIEFMKNNIHVNRELENVSIRQLDPEQMKQVFTNFMLNAIQATLDSGVITVKSCMAAERIRIDIIDNGIGIEKDKINNIFDPFFSTKKGGSGLGLAIAQKIIEEHGGAIAVESEIGIGTKISVFL